MRLCYRARQFWLALGARPEAQQMEQAAKLLPPAQMAVFSGLQPGEQAHALNVLNRLVEQGETHPDLLAAALLHDCGKQLSPLNPLERAGIVLAQKLFPAHLEEWGRTEAVSIEKLPAWRRPLVVAAQHPAWGAELARQAGATPLLQALILRHQQHLEAAPACLEDELLHKLQIVDDQN
jgi:hypothetical protein